MNCEIGADTCGHSFEVTYFLVERDRRITTLVLGGHQLLTPARISFVGSDGGQASCDDCSVLPAEVFNKEAGNWWNKAGVVIHYETRAIEVAKGRYVSIG